MYQKRMGWRQGKGGLRIVRIRESSEKMSVDGIASSLQTCAFDETSVPKLGSEGQGISVTRAGRVTGMETENRHKERGRMNG